MLDRACRDAVENAIRKVVKEKKYLDCRNLSINKDLTRASVIVLMEYTDTSDVIEELLLFNVHLNISHCMHMTEIVVKLSLFEEC